MSTPTAVGARYSESTTLLVTILKSNVVSTLVAAVNYPPKVLDFTTPRGTFPASWVNALFIRLLACYTC